MFQTLAKEYHERFQEVVRARRPHLKNVAGVFDGRVMSATKALQFGLIDQIGYLTDAVETAGQLAKVHAVQPVMYSRENQPMRSLYATMTNPSSNGLLPMEIPGLNRRHLPMFLYLWFPEPGLAKVGS